jgi:hypothetical protein
MIYLNTIIERIREGRKEKRPLTLPPFLVHCNHLVHQLSHLDHTTFTIPLLTFCPPKTYWCSTCCLLLCLLHNKYIKTQNKSKGKISLTISKFLRQNSFHTFFVWFCMTKQPSSLVIRASLQHLQHEKKQTLRVDLN